MRLNIGFFLSQNDDEVEIAALAATAMGLENNLSICNIMPAWLLPFCVVSVPFVFVLTIYNIK